MNLLIPKKVFKQIEELPQKTQRKIYKKLYDLENNKEKYSKLSGRRIPPKWKIKVGDYRIIFIINFENNTAHIDRVGHRKDVYKDL